MGATGSSLPSYDYTNPTNFTDNPSNTTKWFNNEKLSNYAEWKDGLKKKELEAISAFTGSGYKNYKIGQLYDVEWDDMDAQYKQYAANLYDAINKFELRKPITVYRDADTKIFGGSEMTLKQLQDLEGKIVHSNGFMSTSAGATGNAINANQCQMKIIIPKSTGAGAWIANQSTVGTGEREFLLNNNGFFKVDKVSKGSNGKPLVEMRWIGQSKDQIFGGNKGGIDTKTVGQSIKKKK